MISLYEPNIHELNEKYGFDVFARMLQKHLKQYPRIEKQHIRLSGKSMKNFVRHYRV